MQQRSPSEEDDKKLKKSQWDLKMSSNEMKRIIPLIWFPLCQTTSWVSYKRIPTPAYIFSLSFLRHSSPTVPCASLIFLWKNNKRCCWQVEYMVMVFRGHLNSRMEKLWCMGWDQCDGPKALQNSLLCIIK